VFFFNITSVNQPGKESFMKQKPYNDNLVMDSIESLYKQARHLGRPRKNDLQRRNPNNLPIIGSLPVQIGHEQEKSQLDDIVLTGRHQVARTDENHTSFTFKKNADQGQEDNPFLAIRQAVIAAGDEKKQTSRQPTPSAQVKSASETAESIPSETKLDDKLPKEMEKRNFAGQLASLIDSEIERRLAERAPSSHRPNQKMSTIARKRKTQKKSAKKPNNSRQKTAQKSKQKATARLASKKPSPTKRKQPK